MLGIIEKYVNCHSELQLHFMELLKDKHSLDWSKFCTLCIFKNTSEN